MVYTFTVKTTHFWGEQKNLTPQVVGQNLFPRPAGSPKKKKFLFRKKGGNNFPLIGQFILYDVICMFRGW